MSQEKENYLSGYREQLYETGFKLYKNQECVKQSRVSEKPIFNSSNNQEFL